MTSLLHLIWLLWTLVAATFASPASCGASQESIAYDAPGEATIAYDEVLFSAFVYDSASVSSSNVRDNRIVGAGGDFDGITKLLAAKGASVASGMGGEVLPATLVRTIQKGERIGALEAELAQRTYTSGGLEHAVISLNSGERVIVSGGSGGIQFGSDLRRVIGHTHPSTTGPSAADFQMLRDTGQRHSYIYELFGGGRSRFNVKE